MEVMDTAPNARHILKRAAADAGEHADARLRARRDPSRLHRWAQRFRRQFRRLRRQGRRRQGRRGWRRRRGVWRRRGRCWCQLQRSKSARAGLPSDGRDDEHGARTEQAARPLVHPPRRCRPRTERAACGGVRFGWPLRPAAVAAAEPDDPSSAASRAQSADVMVHTPSSLMIGPQLQGPTPSEVPSATRARSPRSSCYLFALNRPRPHLGIENSKF